LGVCDLDTTVVGLVNGERSCYPQVDTLQNRRAFTVSQNWWQYNQGYELLRRHCQSVAGSPSRESRRCFGVLGALVNDCPHGFGGEICQGSPMVLRNRGLRDFLGSFELAGRRGNRLAMARRLKLCGRRKTHRTKFQRPASYLFAKRLRLHFGLGVCAEDRQRGETLAFGVLWRLEESRGRSFTLCWKERDLVPQKRFGRRPCEEAVKTLSLRDPLDPASRILKRPFFRCEVPSSAKGAPLPPPAAVRMTCLF